MNYTEEDFAADLEAVKAATEAMAQGITVAEATGSSLTVADRLHRAFIEGKRFWVDTTKPKRRGRGRKIKPDSLNSFAAWVASQKICARSRTQQLVGAHDLVINRISATRVAVIPETEKQVRPLVSMANVAGHAEAVPQVWAKAVEAALGEQPTATQVRTAVRTYFNDRGLNTKGQPLSTEKPERTKPLTPKQRSDNLRAEARRVLAALHDEDWLAFRDLVEEIDEQVRREREDTKAQLSVVGDGA